MSSFSRCLMILWIKFHSEYNLVKLFRKSACGLFCYLQVSSIFPVLVVNLFWKKVFQFDVLFVTISMSICSYPMNQSPQRVLTSEFPVFLFIKVVREKWLWFIPFKKKKRKKSACGLFFNLLVSSIFPVFFVLNLFRKKFLQVCCIIF